MPQTAWLSQSEVSGEVAGFGPADAETCRELAGWLAAHPATRWCLTLTDRRGGAIAHACASRGPGPPGDSLPVSRLASLRIKILESGDLLAPGARPAATSRLGR